MNFISGIIIAGLFIYSVFIIMRHVKKSVSGSGCGCSCSSNLRHGNSNHSCTGAGDCQCKEKK
ncbi:MAG: FeoB-associated Cys-rich membrane protein [Clostridia bacterium]|nr:FeoB-associated Cys-rich membrane protein [Clostridia bacterium]